MKKLTLIAFSLFIIPAFAQVDIKQGLGAYYPFSGNAGDSSGNANHGTLKNSPTLANDKNGMANSCYFFDGNDQYIEVAPSTSVQPTDELSVAAWVNTTDKDYWNIAICKRLNAAMEPGNSYMLGATGNVPGGSKWQFSISSSTQQHYLVSNTNVEDSTWYSLVGTFSGHELNLYLNAQKIGTLTINHTPVSYSNLTLKLGVATPTSSGNKPAWKGWMDEVRIYNRVLTYDEIRYLHNPATLSADGPVKIDLGVYPNPTNNRMFISCPTALDELYKSTITITDITGKEVAKTNYTTDGIDISGLATGVYFLKVGVFNTTVKFTKE